MTLYMVGWILVRLLVLAILALGIYKLIAFFLEHERSRRKTEGRAAYILRERFASGEIDETEYRERLRVLKS